MLRLRRYRVFIVLAVFATGLLYHFSNLRSIEDATTASVQGLKNFGGLKTDGSSTPKPHSDTEPYGKAKDVEASTERPSRLVSSTVLEEVVATSSTATPTASIERTKTTSSNVASASDDDQSKVVAHTEKDSNEGDEAPKAAPVAAEPNMEHDPAGSLGKGRVEIVGDDALPKIHWKKQKEHFPVPTESLIKLPTGKPKAIPKIQFQFPDEPATEKIDREKKLDTIKKAFKFSWSGYRKNAWMHDELSPVTGRYRDPFCGWSATLVDTLDTLWMMGLKSEFEEATKAVADIDFTTSIRNDIPLFETVIRYLGGLLSAYDLGGSKYKVLLDKAVELAEILMGAFDTPNRMPITFYLWKPTFASQPHRANTRVVLAEIGSLSVEFTRLAQITKEAKYYDAIARIINEFEIWQNNTRIPGLWPKRVDASGCKKEDIPLISPIEHSMQKGAGVTTKQKVEMAPESPESIDEATAASNAGLVKHMIKAGTGNGLAIEDGTDTNSAKKALGTTVEKRQLEPDALLDTSTHPKPDCKPQGLNSPPFTTMEEFTLGGQADSVYEYLPKQFLLLGGLGPQYQTMYESAVETMKEYLLFRPMIPDEKREILFPGEMTASGNLDDKQNLTLKPVSTHLTCFVGGMLGMGAKIFSREDDLELAKQLTDACVWAYESTPTGIMPEISVLLPCDSRKKCAWNETRYWEALDPFGASRSSMGKNHQMVSEDKEAPLDSKPQKSAGQAGASIVKAEQERTSFLSEDSAPNETGEPSKGDSLVKRQLGDIGNDFKESPSSEAEGDEEEARSSTRPTSIEPDRSRADEDASSTKGATATAIATGEADSGGRPASTESAATAATKPVIAQYTPPPIPTQEEYAKARIRDERLPAGTVKVTGSKYILRPEAIESVFIMWRITGDVYWRQKGWDMFKAIHKATRAEFGASAIADVTSEPPVATDEMESFWLAETLKYFYLLFSDPDLISLDDYVLNTEAHPFKRPK